MDRNSASSLLFFCWPIFIRTNRYRGWEFHCGFGVVRVRARARVRVRVRVRVRIRVRIRVRVRVRFRVRVKG